MLRLIHTADVHLGARHDDLGEQAAAQRERQFAAFKAAIDLALAEKVDLFLIAGDLFDSNVQPRRSVERVAAELKRLVEARIRTVIIPGTHDVSTGRRSTVPTTCRPSPGAARRRPRHRPRPGPPGRSTWRPATSSSTAGSSRPSAPRTARSGTSTPRRDQTAATWRIGMVHGAIAIPGKTDRDEVVITTDEIAATHLDYLALGHWHSAQTGKAGTVTYAYAGAPEPVALDQDRAGKVLLVELDERDGARTVRSRSARSAGPASRRREIDAAPLASQPALDRDARAAVADPDLVLDVRLVGVRRDELDLDLDEIETAARPAFLKVRVRDGSLPALTEGRCRRPTRSPARSSATSRRGSPSSRRPVPTAEAAEQRDALRLGRLLLAGHEVSL